MKQIYILYIFLFYRTINLQIKENPIFLINKAFPYVLSTNDDDYYYIITEGSSLKINKEYGVIENIYYNPFNQTSFDYFYIVENLSNNYIYSFFSQKYYHIIYNPFITYEEIQIYTEPKTGNKIMVKVGSITQDDEFVIYGYTLDYYLLFSKKSQYYRAVIRILNINSNLSCKFIEGENYVCVMIINFNLYIYCLKYIIYPKNSQNDKLESYIGNNSLNYNFSISSFGFYDTDESNVKLLCVQNNIIIQCNFLQLILKYDIKHFEYLFIGAENLNFASIYNFNEKNCYLSNFNNEYLFCCAIIDYIKCYRISSYYIVKEFNLPMEGINSHLTIKSNDDFAALFFTNYRNNTNSVYTYYIYLPKCQNRSYNILNSLNENKPEEIREKLLNLFTIKTNKYYFEIKEKIDDFGYFTLNDERMNQRILINNNTDYILDFIVTKNDKSISFTKTVNYIVSVEDDEAYKMECQITLNFKACYHSCEKCSMGIKESNNEHHNCIKCKNNYYPTAENRSNCFSLEKKKANWYFDSTKSKFELCNEQCDSCFGPTKYNCSSCSDGLYLDNNICALNCSEGYYPKRIETNSSYYFICKECFQNCKTCIDEGNTQKMNCETCKENQIKYNDSCFNIFNDLMKIFYDPENKGNNITNCFEKYGLYIKEDSNECIPLPKEDEGYYVSNNETGILSKCHENCLSCYNGPFRNNLGNIQSMECINCKDSNNSEKTMIKINNNCFKILEYIESKITFNNSEMKPNSLGTCIDFGKAIYYGEYECIDKPINAYYILNNTDENTGIIKDCHEACKSCIGAGSEMNTNCIECTQGYIKTEDSETHCIKNDSIFLKNYYLNKIDNIYYHCYQNCNGCYGSYNSTTKDMYCLECINEYYFIYEESNCYNYTFLQNNKYYFNHTDFKFHKCYYTCSECLNFEPNETNHFCLKCNSGYYFLENTNNCYNMNLTEKGYYLNNINTKEEEQIFQKCYNSCKTCFYGMIVNSTTNKENHNCIECEDNYYKIDNDLYPNNCYDNETINSFKVLKISTIVETTEKDNTNVIICLNNTFITPDKDCALTCPNGTYQFSLNNSCLYSCPQNYIIENNKCLFKNFDIKTTVEDFKNQISDDITSYINSSNIINGSNFLAVVLSSDNMEPEEQIKNGISAIDLGNCTNVIKEYYNISNEESLIVLNMELKNDDYQKSQMSNDDDKSFNLGSNTQLEIYDYSGRKLNLSICREDIKVMKPLNNFENQFDMNSAKSLSEQGIDVFDKNDKFFNDICHPYDNSEGKDITLNDRRKDIYQDVTFCQNGCNYNGINYNLNAVNCICDSSYLQDENKTNNENEPKISKFESITESFIASLISFNFDILRCYNLSFNIKILLSNIGFYCLLLMFVLQLIFFFIYLIKKLKPLKNFLLLYQKNKRRNIKNDAMRNPPPKNSIKKSFINGNNINKNSNNKKKYIKNDFNKKKHNKLYNKNDIITNNNKGRRSLNKIIVEDTFNKLKIDSSNNILSSSKHSKYTNLKKGKLIRNKYALNINIESPIININNNSKKDIILGNDNNNENIYNTKLKKYQFNKKGNNIKDIHKILTLQGIIYKKNIKSKINKENIIILSKSDSELQDLDYEEAIIYDKRSFLRMCWGFLLDSQIILGTFCTDNHLDLFVIKLSFLVFTFQISFFLNALFYTDEYISDAYHNDGVLDFFSGLPKCFYSFIATLITTNLLRMLSSSKNELIKVIRSNTKFSNFKSLINIKLKKLRIKLIIYFILLFALESLFLYYVTVFCAVYRNSQKYWFLGCLQSFGIDFLTAFAGCIFLSLFRYISIKKHIKCLYIFTNIINSFL